MIKKLNDFEKNMLLMAGSAGVGMLYSYVLYNNVHNNAFSVASILGLFFLGAFILSFSIRLVRKKLRATAAVIIYIKTVQIPKKTRLQTQKKDFITAKKTKTKNSAKALH